MYDQVIVRYGEIFLKSEYVKRQFENKLLEDIRLTLELHNVRGKINRKRHRVYVETGEGEKAAELISRVYGVVSTSPATKTTTDLEDIGDAGLKIARKTIERGDSFAVDAKRTGRQDYTSIDVEKAVASKILGEIDVKVDLKNPEKTVYVEVNEDEAYVFDKKVRGVGGLPYGTQGKVICLISSGIDSPVAAWMMMHRGCEAVFLNFRTGGCVDGIIERLQEYTPHRLRTYKVDYERILEEIASKAGKYTCVVCKRTMLRIAGRLMEKEKAYGIVTGDNLGQVASQTLENLKILDDAAQNIYRPLIGMDKEEIIRRAEEIGTYECKDKKKCPYVPKLPATTSRLEKIKEIEEEIGIEELVGCVELG